MPDNGQNNFRNKDIYNSLDPPQGGRSNNVGQVQSGAPPYGEPRAYNGSSPQPYQQSQIYPGNPGYPKQSSQQQARDPYAPGGNNGVQQNKPYTQGGGNAPVRNPYGGPTNSMYGGSPYNEGETVYERAGERGRTFKILLTVSIVLVLAIVGALAYFFFFKDKDSDNSSSKSVTAAVTENTTAPKHQQETVTVPAVVTEPDDPGSGDLVETPDVTGMNMRVAKTKLSEMGFRVKFAEAYSSEIGADNVISQNISAGTKVPLDTEITLTVSKGREPQQTVEMLSVKDMDYKAASDALIAIGLDVQLEFRSSSVEKDRIISQSEASGTKLSKGSKIVLVVSQGDAEE